MNAPPLPTIIGHRRPKIFGHRASRAEGILENSPAAFQAAAVHADGMETDAVLSSDGEIFFVHDTLSTGLNVVYELNIRLDEPSRQRTAGRRMDQMTAAEIRTLRLADGQKIPEMPDLFALMQDRPDFIVNIELKADNIFIPVAAYLDRHAAAYGLDRSRFVFTSFNHPLLRDGRARYPGYRLGPLYPAGNTVPMLMFPWSENRDAGYTPFSRDALDDPLIRALAPDIFSLTEYDLRPEILADIRENFPAAQAMVWWWLHQSEPPPQQNARFAFTLHALAAAGVHDMLYAIITDYPVAMKEFLEGIYL